MSETSLEVSAGPTTLAHRLGAFTADTSFEDLPKKVISESKRILLDSIGCAVAAAASEWDVKSRAALSFAAAQGQKDDSATVFGAAQRSSLYGAAFANGELINALDYDAVLPPGHVSPYVLPGALAVAEDDRVSGRALITAVSIAHEMSNRFGSAMDYIRDTQAGRVSWPPVLGYTSAVFGATAAISKLRGADRTVASNALAIAASTSPVNSLRSWVEHAPAATIKYTMAGPLIHTALSAASMAEFGHRGDPGVLEDAEVGYPRFIGTRRWDPEKLIEGLGDDWRFARQNAFKHYPHCRALHGLLDLLTDSLEDNAIATHEITAIRAWGEGHVEKPVWLTTDIGDPMDAQFSIAHGLAVGAQRLPPSRSWQDPSTVFDPEVLGLMRNISYATHPEWVDAIASDPTARPSRIEIEARGEVFVSELRHPRGTPGAVGTAGQPMTDHELIGKFRVNVTGTLGALATDRVIEEIMHLEDLSDVSDTLRALGAPR